MAASCPRITYAATLAPSPADPAGSLIGESINSTRMRAFAAKRFEFGRFLDVGSANQLRSFLETSFFCRPHSRRFLARHISFSSEQEGGER
jgi:hypothetical protein